MHGSCYILCVCVCVCVCACVCVCVCVRACVCLVLCSPYLEDLDGIGPVWVGVLPRFAIGQALCKHVQIENGVVFGVLDLALKQLHDVQESVQWAADVHDCRQKNGNDKQDVCLNMVKSLQKMYDSILIL